MLITDQLIYKGFLHFALQKIVAKETVVLQPDTVILLQLFLISTGLEGLRLKMSLLATIKKKKNPGDEDEKLSRQTAATEMKVIYLLQNLKCQLQHRRQNLF